MRRISISIENDLADKFDELLVQQGYQNRSEAFRDLMRRDLNVKQDEIGGAKYCAASLSYVYNHHERQLASRLTALQHEHHDVILATTHAHLDHDNCLETVILKGSTAAVTQFAQSLIAEKGVRHGKLNLVPVELRSSYLKSQRHVHLHPQT